MLSDPVSAMMQLLEFHFTRKLLRQSQFFYDSNCNELVRS